MFPITENRFIVVSIVWLDWVGYCPISDRYFSPGKGSDENTFDSFYQSLVLHFIHTFHNYCLSNGEDLISFDLFGLYFGPF